MKLAPLLELPPLPPPPNIELGGMVLDEAAVPLLAVV